MIKDKVRLDVELDCYKKIPIEPEFLKYIKLDDVQEKDINRLGQRSYKIVYDKGIKRKDQKLYYGYCRNSSLAQLKTKSLQTQQQAIRDYVKNDNGFLKAIYIDQALSGSKEITRNALLWLKKDIEPESHLLVEFQDRLGRDATESNTTKDELLKRGIITITTSDKVSNATAGGRTVGKVQTTMSELERIHKNEVTESHMGTDSRNATLRTRSPYGYKIMNDPTDEKMRKKILVKDEVEQEAIQEMIKVYNEHRDWSYSKICRYMNEKPTTFPLRDAKEWYVSSFKKILESAGIEFPKFNANKNSIDMDAYENLLKKYENKSEESEKEKVNPIIS